MLVAVVGERPPEARCEGSPLIVVDHDAAVVADAQAPQEGGEALGRRELRRDRIVEIDDIHGPIDE